jgi:hypothetical protein
MNCPFSLLDALAMRAMSPDISSSSRLAWSNLE